MELRYSTAEELSNRPLLQIFAVSGVSNWILVNWLRAAADALEGRVAKDEGSTNNTNGSEGPK